MNKFALRSFTLLDISLHQDPRCAVRPSSYVMLLRAKALRKGRRIWAVGIGTRSSSKATASRYHFSVASHDENEERLDGHVSSFMVNQLG